MKSEDLFVCRKGHLHSNRQDEGIVVGIICFQDIWEGKVEIMVRACRLRPEEKTCLEGEKDGTR